MTAHPLADLALALLRKSQGGYVLDGEGAMKLRHALEASYADPSLSGIVRELCNVACFVRHTLHCPAAAEAIMEVAETAIDPLHELGARVADQRDVSQAQARRYTAKLLEDSPVRPDRDRARAIKGVTLRNR